MKYLYLVLLALPVFSQAQLQFATNVLTNENSGYSETENLQHIDIDQDGDKDIFASSYGSMVVYERLADGTFSLPKKINHSFATFEFAQMGDITDDGLPDIVLITQYAMCLLPNTGSLTDFMSYSVINTNNVPSEVQFHDRDGDGDLDLFFFDTYNAGWFINNNNSNVFTFSSYFGSNVGEILIDDVNGDNAADFVYKSDYNMSYITYDATATTSYDFQETLDGFALGGFQKAADLDGDGDKDIVFAYLNGLTRQLVWYKNNGASGFATKVVIANLPANPSGVYVGNVNSAGPMDIVLTYNDPDKITWIKSNGNGSFATEQILTTKADLVRQVIIADADGDTFNDILFSSYYDMKVSFLKSNGTENPTFVEVRLNKATFGAFSVEAGDLDNDGDRDIVQASLVERKISWFKNDNSTFTSDQIIIQEFETYAPRNLQLTDIDNDGDNDLLYFSSWEPNLDNASELVLLKNSNNGATFTKSIIFSINEEIVTYTLLDVDNDGDQDLVVAANNNILRLFKNNGAGVFSAGVIFSEYLYNRAPGAVAADIDNDGDIDIASARSDGEVCWYTNINGNFTQKNLILAPNNSSYALVASDYDSDGDQDLLYTGHQSNRIGVFKNQGTGVFDAPLIISSTIYRPRGLQAVDLELDGDIDIVCGSEEQIVLAYINNGSAVFDSVVVAGDEPNATRDIATADFTGDGLPDFAVVSYDDSSVVWLQNKGIANKQLSGKLQFDVAADGCDTTDYGISQQLVQASEGTFSSSVFTSNGNYQIDLSSGTYTVETLGISDVFSVNPQTTTVTLNDATVVLTQDFCVAPAGATDDLELSLYPINAVRAGFAHQVLLVVKNVGTTEKNALVNVFHEPSKMLFANALPEPITNQNGQLQFEINNLKPFTEQSFTLNFTTAAIPIVSINEVLNLGAEITESVGDATPGNNSTSVNQSVIASYDPNDITCFEGGDVAIENANNYLHYRIRFENTGNTFADRVVIKTTLDNNLDWNSIQLEGSSHNYIALIKNGNELTFTFNAIYLPAAAQNPIGAQGYVLFKIKPKNSVAVGSQVAAMANIYFDFNPPIITNIALTTFIDATLVTKTTDVNAITLYPNPVTDSINSSQILDWQSIEVINILGNLVLQQADFPLNVSALEPGVYLVRAIAKSGEQLLRKIVKR